MAHLIHTALHTSMKHVSGEILKLRACCALLLRHALQANLQIDRIPNAEPNQPVNRPVELARPWGQCVLLRLCVRGAQQLVCWGRGWCCGGHPVPLTSYVHGVHSTAVLNAKKKKKVVPEPGNFKRALGQYMSSPRCSQLFNHESLAPNWS